ncbi:Uncharacterised protein [uncultured archaeon]|nr:Uncharacterised protein [uncultured archaeon]
MKKYCIPVLLVFVLIAGCTAPDGDKMAASTTHDVSPSPAPIPMSLNTPPISPVQTVSSPAATPKPAEIIQKFNEKTHASAYENKSVAVEVNYREYVDWFMAHNLNIRIYTPEEYVCGQYTVDMINDSTKAGYKAYFAAITFTDGSGHALLSFKSTVFGYSSWYFFEPQTNKLMSQETIEQVLNQNLGKTVAEVNVYGYFDDAGDKDPTTWRFAYPLYTKKY